MCSTWCVCVCVCVFLCCYNNEESGAAVIPQMGFPFEFRKN